MRKTFCCVLICIPVLAHYAHADDDLPSKEVREAQRRANAIALYTKLLCSGVFVCGRAPQDFIDEDLQGEHQGMPSWSEIAWHVDDEAKTVTLSAPDVEPRTAVYHPSQGATLLPKGAEGVHFTPLEFSPQVPDPATTPWPMGDVVPEEALPESVDEAALNAALDYAFDESKQDLPQHTRAIVVVHKGRLVAERYAEGFSRDSRHIGWSMGKSTTAALVGILVGQGHFTVDDPAPIPAWQGDDDPRRHITVRHLLNMSGGLEFHMGNPLQGTMLTEADDHRKVYFGAVNVFDYSISKPLEYEPGTEWRYRNCDPLALGKIIRNTVEAKGEDYLSWPQRVLFDKLGMRHMVLEVDAWGNFIMTGFDYGTARDWARFGLLHVQDGVWQGERILPEGWVDFIRTPAPADPRKGYGGLFWLNAGGDREGWPKDAYLCGGHMGQFTIMIPSLDLVIVRLGHSDRGGEGAYIEEVVRRIIAAIGV